MLSYYNATQECAKTLSYTEQLSPMLLSHVHSHSAGHAVAFASLSCCPVVTAPLDFPYNGDCLVAFGTINVLTDARTRIPLLCISCLRLFGHSSGFDLGFVAVSYCHRLYSVLGGTDCHFVLYQ